MSNASPATHLFRSTLLLTIVLIVSPVLFAQSAAIQPCDAEPPVKSGSTNATLTPTKVNTKAKETIVDSSIADDAAMEKMLAPYAEKVRPLNIVIGKLEGEMKKGTVGAGTLGNFVTDAMLAEARKKSSKNVVLAILNGGGLRKNEIAAGQLRASDIFELLPFENALITLDMTGAQLLKLSQPGTRDAQAGARVRFRWNEQNRTEPIGVKLVDANRAEHEIDSNAVYTIVTIDYLYKLGSGAYAILQEGKNLTSLNITVRDAVIDYVKSETAAGRSIRARLDDRFVQVGPGPANQENPRND